MLHKSTIHKSTLRLIEELQLIEEFSQLRLVGGTALALQIGHRISIDIDLFGKVDFEGQMLNDFNNVQLIKKSKNINIYSSNDVKVDFVNYKYPWLEDELRIEGVRLAGLKDIAAMKIAAITGRGSRKDFVDIFFCVKAFLFR